MVVSNKGTPKFCENGTNKGTISLFAQFSYVKNFQAIFGKLKWYEEKYYLSVLFHTLISKALILGRISINSVVNFIESPTNSPISKI